MPAPGQLVAVGSSSVRRWETAAWTLRDWGLVQRGFGGAELIEVAERADELVGRFSPGGVLLFAGTNDVAGGASAELVSTAYRCFVQRVFAAAGPVPILFIGITPTPARWGTWDTSAAVNAEVIRLAGLHPMLHYVDVPTPFLATGSPPDSSLFVSDMLHLSEAGYGLWDEAVRGSVEAVLPKRAAASGGGASSGSFVRVDLGPSNAADGARAPSVDGFGNRWNSWHGAEGGEQILAGESTLR